MEKKPKRTLKIVERERTRDQMLEQVTETTYRRIRTVQRGHESDSSEEDIPQVEWRKIQIINQRRESGQSTSTPIHSEPKTLIYFCGLVGSECADKVTAGSLLELEASTDLSSPQTNIHERNDSKIIEVDLTADSPTASQEINLVGGRKNYGKSRKDEFRQAEQLEDNNLHNLSKLFDRNLLAELTTEVT